MSMISKILMVAVVGFAMQACGGGGGGADTSKFTGIWHPSSGTLTITCPGEAADTSAITDNVTWLKGASSDLVQTDPSTSCVLNAKITGSTALSSGATCTFMQNGITYMLTITAYTFALAADGQTATENESGSVVASANGQTETCQVSSTASFQKLSS